MNTKRSGLASFAFDAFRYLVLLDAAKQNGRAAFIFMSLVLRVGQ